jgi:hypothetical protein
MAMVMGGWWGWKGKEKDKIVNVDGLVVGSLAEDVDPDEW